MGCNNSRLNANGEAVPARIRPLLLRRIEELRKLRNGASLRGEGTLSKKQLLKGDTAEEEDDDDQSSNEDENKHKISSKETQHAAKEQTQQTVVRLVEKLSKVVPLPASEYGTEEQHDKHEDHGQEKVKDVENKDKVDLVTDNEECSYCIWPPPENNKHEEVNAKRDDDHDDHDDSDEKDDGDDDDDEEEEEEEEEEDENGRFLGPGSPSFKIYVEDEKIKEEQRENQTIAVHQKSPSADSFESAASASGNSNEVVEIESTTKRKGHKLKKLGAVKKNLLKVKNMQVKHRMNPMFSCGSNDRKSLLSTK